MHLYTLILLLNSVLLHNNTFSQPYTLPDEVCISLRKGIFIHTSSEQNKSVQKDQHFNKDSPVLIKQKNTGIIRETAPILADSTITLPVSYFYEPYPQEIGATILQLGGSFSLLPLPVVENEYPSPAIDLRYKRGMFKNISLVASFQTNVFTNLFHTGLQWNMNIDRFSFGFANHLGGFVGFLAVEGQFERNSAYALFDFPILRLGYRFDDFCLSMSWTISYVFASASKVSDLEAPGPTKTINDFFCTIAIEQPFLKAAHLSLGFIITYSRTPYQSWFLYNTIDQYLIVPEFFFSFQL